MGIQYTHIHMHHGTSTILLVAIKAIIFCYTSIANTITAVSVAIIGIILYDISNTNFIIQMKSSLGLFHQLAIQHNKARQGSQYPVILFHTGYRTNYSHVLQL